MSNLSVSCLMSQVGVCRGSHPTAMKPKIFKNLIRKIYTYLSWEILPYLSNSLSLLKYNIASLVTTSGTQGVRKSIPAVRKKLIEHFFYFSTIFISQRFHILNNKIIILRPG